MLVLGIETSCDETAAAILDCSNEQPEILSEVISSQDDLHSLYGGVVPELASREHLRNLPLILNSALTKSGVVLGELSGIGVTRGPGLKGCLLVGVDFVKGLALSTGLPWIGVNHIEGHLHAAALDNIALKTPYLALVVSGGHTEIVKVETLGKYQIMARTIDDAAGEAFDKAANLLGLEYPGGAKLAGLADSVANSRYTLPKVMREIDDISFSGLKTAFSLLVQRTAEDAVREPQVIPELAFVMQEAIVSALIHKLNLAVQATGLSDVVVTGGVAANHRLRTAVGAMAGVRSWFPSPTHCTDNAAMIAHVAAKRLRAGMRDDYSLEVAPRWPVEEVQAL